MTITLHWWFIPLALSIAGVWIGSRARGMDFVTPFISLGFFAAALFCCIGHWLA